MTEAHIGRLLTASLHQAIGEELPQRIDFYEHWLRSEALREGTIGLAPLTAVLGFLRTEHDEGYARVMQRAGALAAEWSLASMSPTQKQAIMWLPRGLRSRAALRVVTGLVRDTCSASRASARLRKGSARVEVRASLFCSVREAPRAPLCGFYLALAMEILRRFALPSQGRVVQCHAIEHTACVLALDLAGAALVADPAIAA
jgi:hypothetical protein